MRIYCLLLLFLTSCATQQEIKKIIKVESPPALNDPRYATRSNDAIGEVVVIKNPGGHFTLEWVCPDEIMTGIFYTIFVSEDLRSWRWLFRLPANRLNHVDFAGMGDVEYFQVFANRPSPLNE